MSGSRKRNERGQYVETITVESVLTVLRTAETPVVTAKEVGERLGCTSEAARQKLLTLLDQGTVARRKVGASAVVWWITAEAGINSEEFDPDDPLFDDPPTFASDTSDVSHNIDEYVADAVAKEHDA